MFKKLFKILFILIFLSPNIAYSESSRLEGIIEAFREALETGKEFNPEAYAVEFGYKNFDEFAYEYIEVHSLKDTDITPDDIKNFISASDKNVIIDQSQENLDKLYSLILNNKLFKKRTSYFKTFEKGTHKGNKIDQMALAVYINFEKEMANITKNPNTDKTSPFAWGFGFSWGSGSPYRYALEYCEKDAKKYKLFGGECIIVDYRNPQTGVIENKLKASVEITKGNIEKLKNRKINKQTAETNSKKSNVKKRAAKSSNSKIILPISVKIVQIDEPNYRTDITTKEVVKYFEDASLIWAQSNIYLDVIEIEKTDANTRNFLSNVAYMDKNFNQQLNQYKSADEEKYTSRKAKRDKRRIEIIETLISPKKYINKNAINVYFIPRMLNIYSCGIAKMTYLGNQSMGMIKNNKIDGYAVIGSDVPPGCNMPIVIAHEIGHLLSLPHEGTTGVDLMMWGNGTQISEESEKIVRKFYNKHLLNKFN